MFWRDWARKDLQRGDLNALVELKRGWALFPAAEARRLVERFLGNRSIMLRALWT
jgi:hypothetical protein